MLKLREFRDATGKKEEAVAADIGVSTSTVSRHETETTKLRLPDLAMWAEYYDVHPAELFAGVKICPPHLADALTVLEDLTEEDIQSLLDLARRLKRTSAA